MNGERVKVATWNIGGGILGASHQTAGTPQLDHHLSVIRHFNPDILCLQEAHDFGQGEPSQTEVIATAAEYPHYASVPLSPSHLSPDASLALGIMSRFPVRDVRLRLFENPGLRATGPNGRPWTLADKGYLRAVAETPRGPLQFLNLHAFPLHRFGADATEPRFASIWRQLEDELDGMSKKGPALAVGDFNYPEINKLLSVVLNNGTYNSSFEVPTSGSDQKDYMLCSPKARVLGALVARTETDHRYCQTTISMAGGLGARLFAGLLRTWRTRDT